MATDVLRRCERGDACPPELDALLWGTAQTPDVAEYDYATWDDGTPPPTGKKSKKRGIRPRPPIANVGPAPVPPDRVLVQFAPTACFRLDPWAILGYDPFSGIPFLGIEGVVLRASRDRPHPTYIRNLPRVSKATLEDFMAEMVPCESGPLCDALIAILDATVDDRKRLTRLDLRWPLLATPVPGGDGKCLPADLHPSMLNRVVTDSPVLLIRSDTYYDAVSVFYRRRMGRPRRRAPAFRLADLLVMIAMHEARVRPAMVRPCGTVLRSLTINRGVVDAKWSDANGLPQQHHA